MNYDPSDANTDFTMQQAKVPVEKKTIKVT